MEEGPGFLPLYIFFQKEMEAAMKKIRCKKGKQETKKIRFKPDLDSNVPVVYAVFEVICRDGKAVDTRYVYVNRAYCRLTGHRKEELLGRRFSKVYENADEKWFRYCYAAAFEGKKVRDRMYSPEIGQWLEFEVEPAGKGLAAFVFINVDTDHKEKMSLRRSSVTDDIIIHLAKIMEGGESYDKAVNRMLAELGSVLHPDRLYILETDGKTVSNTFEWCREGVKPEIHTLQDLPYDEYIGGWEKFLVNNTSVVLDDISVLAKDDPIDYENLKRQGIRSIMEAPIYDTGRLIGYIGADNYEISDAVNNQKILETVSYFLGARMVNQRLLKKLDYMSRYDMLTGVWNRNALISCMEELKKKRKKTAGLVFADVNGLKRANDRGGHAAGDILIRTAARTLQDFWGKDNVYRAGGDEFAVILPGVEEKKFNRRFDSFYASLQERKDLSLACGAQWTESSAHIDEAMNRADRKMYKDKRAYYLCMNGEQ